MRQHFFQITIKEKLFLAEKKRYENNYKKITPSGSLRQWTDLKWLEPSRLLQPQTRVGKISNWYKSCILKWGLEEMLWLETSNIYYLFQAWWEHSQSGGWEVISQLLSFRCSPASQGSAFLALQSSQHSAQTQINQQIKPEAYFHVITSDVTCPFQAWSSLRPVTHQERGHQGSEGGDRAGEAEAWPQVGFSWWGALASVSSHSYRAVLSQ